MLANSIAYLTLKFILLHEIGHHMNGDVLSVKTDFNLSELKNAGNDLNVIDKNIIQSMEIGADFFATTEILKDYFAIKKYLNKYISHEIGYTDVFQIINFAILIPFFIINDGIDLTNIEQATHPSNVARQIICQPTILTLTMNSNYISYVIKGIIREHKRNEILKNNFISLYGVSEYENTPSLIIHFMHETQMYIFTRFCEAVNTDKEIARKHYLNLVEYDFLDKNRTLNADSKLTQMFFKK